MNRNITLPLVIFFTSLILYSCSTSRKIDTTLAKVYERDQNIRKTAMELTRSVSQGNTMLVDSLVKTTNKMNQIDEENIIIVENILKNSIPENLSKESYETIWLVIDHASLEKQERYLPIIEEMTSRRIISNNRYAILYDRIAMKQNRLQRYGTQTIQIASDNTLRIFVWPVENPDKLDSLRNSINQKPITEYTKVISEETGIQAIYDPNLSIEDINKMKTGRLEI